MGEGQGWGFSRDGQAKVSRGAASNVFLGNVGGQTPIPCPFPHGRGKGSLSYRPFRLIELTSDLAQHALY